MRTVGFYFDFISPYGYLGSLGIEALASRMGFEVDWRPMLLGVSVMKVMGLPPVGETPLKGAYYGRDFPRCFRFLGVPLRSAGPMQPLPAGRAFSWLRDLDPELGLRFARAVYRAHWSEGRDMSTPAALAGVAEPLGIERERLVAAIADPAVKARHRARVEESLARGVFGSPTFEIDGELFWGHDRLPQVERWLEQGGF